MSGNPEEDTLVKQDGDGKEKECEVGIPLIPERNPKGKVKMSSTKDAAVMALLCMSNGFEVGLLWPFLLHIIVQALQFFLVVQFFAQKVLPLSAMFKSPQLELVETFIDTAINTNTKIQDFNATTFLDNPAQWQMFQYQNDTVSPWIYERCQINLAVSQKWIDGLMLALIMLLFGKFCQDLSSFTENVDLLLFKMSSVVDADRDQEKGRQAIKKALSTPASKTSITSVALHVKIIIVVLIYLPHFICQTMIVFNGAQYVLVQPTLGVMIKSALKIYFIVKFSGYIFKAYTGENMKKLTSGAVMTFSSEEVKPEYGWWQSVCKACLIFIVALCGSLVFIYAVGSPVHNVGNLCDAYADTFGGKTSNPFPIEPECLPEGEAGTCGLHWLD